MSQKEITEQLESGTQAAGANVIAISINLRPDYGVIVLNGTHPNIKCTSKVMVSATEYYNCSHMGAAGYTVMNVAPYNGGVKVRLNIEHTANLPIRLSFLIVV